MRLLLVEDDPMVGSAVQKGLRDDGHGVDWVRDGRAAELALDAGGYDLVLLDLGLPRKSGIELLAGLRARKDATPVIVVTARDAIDDRIRGLDAGADDYLVKPFDLDELAARIRAVHRRRAGRAETAIEHRGLAVDPVARTVTLDGAPVPVSPREFAVLHALVEQPGVPISRRRLEERVYAWGEEVGSNAVEVHIHALRRKLGAERIVNVRGVGWMIPKAE